MKKKKNLIKLVNFCYAFQGILFLVRTERNPTLYLIGLAVVIVLGLYYHVSRYEWLAIVIAASLVWMAEALNTAIELLADEISLEQRERLGWAKDVAAGGVLLAGIGALVVGGMVFWPHVLK